MLAVGSFLLFLSAAAAATTDADADSRAVQIELDPPEGCPGPADFFRALRSRTARVREAVGDEPRTTLEVRLVRGRGQVTGELRVLDSAGGTETRKVQGTSCAEVVHALSLTAALAVDPDAVLSVPAPATAPAEAGAPSEVAARPPKAEPPKPQPSSEEAPTIDEPAPVPPRPPPVLELGAGSVGASLLAGSFSPGVALAARKTLRHDGSIAPSLGIALVYLRNDWIVSAEAVRASLAAVAGLGCPLRWSASVLTLQPCGHVVAGWLSASGRQVSHAYTVDRLWLSAGASTRFLAHLGHGLFLELETGVTMPLFKRKFFATQPSNVVSETPTISPVVGAGITLGL